MPVAYFETLDSTQLMQGDVLRRTAEINAILEEIHPYYSDEKNLYFMVLTQTCDLVERRSGSIKAPYIVVSPIRNFTTIVENFIEECDKLHFNCEVAVLGEKSRNKFNDFLDRLYNNNDPHHFYLNAENTALEVDCVTLLRQSVALRIPVHLDACKAATILQLKEIFQTKLGWLVGQLYSRVATDDWDGNELAERKKKIIKDAAVWAPDESLTELERTLKKEFPNHRDQIVDRVSVGKVLRSLPTKKNKLSAREYRRLSRKWSLILARFLFIGPVLSLEQ